MLYTFTNTQVERIGSLQVLGLLNVTISRSLQTIVDSATYIAVIT